MEEIKVKKSVALSGVPAGSTALSAVGGADLHYRGYSIKDLAANCQFEEVAYLLVHGALPTQAQLDTYKAKLKGLRGLSPQVKTVLEQLPATAHAMDVLRTGFQHWVQLIQNQLITQKQKRATLQIQCWQRLVLCLVTGTTLPIAESASK